MLMLVSLLLSLMLSKSCIDQCCSDEIFFASDMSDARMAASRVGSGKGTTYFDHVCTPLRILQ